MDIAANVLFFDEARQGVGGGGFDLAAVLAQLGRNPVEVERAVDVFFGCGGDLCSVIEAGERVLAERVAALERALTTVTLCILEPVKYCSAAPKEARGRRRTSICSPVRRRKLTLFWPLRDELRDGGIGGGVLDSGGDGVLFAGRAGDEHVEIADCVAAAAERTGRGDAFDAGKS